MEIEIEKFTKKLYRFKPQYLYGYPSAIIQFADYLKELKLNPPPIKVAICSAEQLTQSSADFISQFFNTQVSDIYGAAEVGIISSQCPHGGRHIPIESIWVDIENEQKLLNNVKVGDVVVTDLNNSVMPIIRYAIGDLSNYETETCSCGLPHPLLREVQGRKLEFIKTRKGKSTNSVFTYYLFKGFESKVHSIKQYQLVQKSEDHFLVKIVMDQDLNDDHVLYFENTLKEYLGTDIQVAVSQEKDIPVGPSGKFEIFRKEM